MTSCQGKTYGLTGSTSNDFFVNILQASKSVISPCVQSGTAGVLGVENGGTGLDSLSPTNSLLASGTTTTSAVQVLPTGNLNEVLTSSGPGALPTWQASSLGGVSSVSGSTASGFRVTTLNPLANPIIFVSADPTLVTGILKVTNGTGDITTAIAADFPILNQSTTGNAATATTALTATSVTTNANLTGPVTSVGNATSVTNLAITNAMIANSTIDLAAKVTGLLPAANMTVMTNLVGGAVPAPPNNTTTFLRGDGTFATPPGGTVTGVTGSSLNGFTVNVTPATPNPDVTVGTSVTGIVTGDGTGISGTSAAVPFALVTAGATTSTVSSTATAGVLGNVLLSGGPAAVPTWLPNGTNTQVLTLSGGVPIWAAPTVTDPLTLAVNAPATPAAGTVTVFRNNRGSIEMPGWIDPEGGRFVMQPHLAFETIGCYLPQGNGSTASLGFGMPGVTVSAVTVTSPAFATTNLLTRSKRVGYATNNSAGNVASQYIALTQVTSGGPSLGGFFYSIRFAFSNIAPGAVVGTAANAFFGLMNLTTPQSNVDPATLLRLVGVGRSIGSANLQFYCAGGGAQPALDLGAGFPANDLTTVYDLVLASPNAASTRIYFSLTNVNTGATTSATRSGLAVVPGPTVWLNHNCWISNGAAAEIVEMSIMRWYLMSND
jgi:hypothetical protein